MAVQQLGETFKCETCGNVVSVLEVGGGTLQCCGNDLQKIEV